MKLKRTSLAVLIATATLGASLAPPAIAQSQKNVAREIPYKVKSGDTLIGITQRLLRAGLDWRDLGAVNSLKRPDSIRPNQTIYIPSVWLKPTKMTATIDSVSGSAQLNGKPAERRAEISESDEIRTGKAGVVVVRLPDGTEMSIAPDSQVRVDRLRGYFGTTAIDARLNLKQGAIESNTPESPDSDVVRDIRIKTPKATAAVRGTHFRISDSTERSSNSVLEGKVAWGKQGKSTNLPGGFGSSANPQGKTTDPEVLLKAPEISIAQTKIRQASVKVPFTPVKGATAYKVRVAANTSFSRDVSEQTVSDASFALDSQRDGNHFVSVRAISENGVEGLDKIGKLTFLARPFAPESPSPADASQHFIERVSLRWQAQPEAVGYRIQIASDPQFKSIEIDRRVKEAGYPYRVLRSESETHGAATRYWRVATVDGWTVGPFSPTQQFTVRKPAPQPRTTSDKESVNVAWTAVPEATGYIVRISNPRNPDATLREARSDKPGLTLSELKPGKYQATISTVFGNLQSPPGAASAFEIQAPPAPVIQPPAIRFTPTTDENEYPRLTTP